MAALVINPYGLEMLKVPFQTLSIGALQDFIQEWNSPNFHEHQVWPFVALLFATLGVIGASRKRLDWSDFLLLSGTAFMALLAGRNIALFAVVATPILTYHLDAVLAERGWVLRPVRRPSSRMALINSILVALIVLASLAKVLLVLDAKTVAKEQAQYLPVDATAFYKDNGIQGPLFNSYNWGGYLIWNLPDEPVFVDGRTDLYGDEFLRTYLEAATGATGWDTTVDKYDIHSVLVEAGSGLALRLRDAPGWTLAYEDDMAVVFTRGAVSDG